MSNKQKGVITVEDYNNSGKSFISVDDCPATIALKRLFGIQGTLDPTGQVVQWGDDKIEGMVGTYSPNWTAKEYEDLAENNIEFHFEIEFI